MRTGKRYGQRAIKLFTWRHLHRAAAPDKLSTTLTANARSAQQLRMTGWLGARARAAPTLRSLSTAAGTLRSQSRARPVQATPLGRECAGGSARSVPL